MQLALAMGRTLGELYDTMSEDEFMLWQARAEAGYPVPDPYWIGAMQAYVTARCLSDKKAKIKITDFMPSKTKKALSGQAAMDAVRAIFGV